MDKYVKINSDVIGTIEHIGIIVPNVRELRDRLTDSLYIDGLSMELNTGGLMYYHGEPEEIRLDIAFTRLAGQYIEYVTPVSGRSCHMDFLKETGGGVHHLGLMFESIEKKEEAAEYFRAQGCEEVHRAQGPSDDPAGQLYIFDARKLLGTYVELLIPVPFEELPPARKAVMR